MYMREMGTVELLTREGEIEIAKRIEDGLRHMIQAISPCPTTIAEILRMATKVEKDEMRIDELVDGFIDPNEADDCVAEEDAEAEESSDDDEDDDEEAGAKALTQEARHSSRAEALERFDRHRASLQEDAQGLCTRKATAARST